MKTTIFGVLLDVTPEQDTVLRRLMRKYGFMLRFAFNRILSGLSNIGALERHLSSDTEWPLRYAKDAVQEAQDLIRARHQFADRLLRGARSIFLGRGLIRQPSFLALELSHERQGRDQNVRVEHDSAFTRSGARYSQAAPCASASVERQIDR